MTETETFVPVGIVLGDKAAIIALGHTPAPPCYEALITKVLERTTGHSEITAGIVHDITTINDFARIGVDSETHEARVFRIMTITIVEEGQGIVCL